MIKRLLVLTSLTAVLSITFSIAPAAAQPLAQAERDATVKHLTQSRESFVKSIANLSDAQWTFKAAPDRWSIAEIAEHIAVSETTIFEIITGKILKGPAISPGVARISNDKLLEGLVDRSSKFSAPEMLKPSNRWATRDALTKDFLAAREKTSNYVAQTSDPLHAHGGPHPVFKMLDGHQWILLISGHAARHTAQIEEVKASAGFPAR